MANLSFPPTGFVETVDPGEEACVEPVKDDLNFLNAKFDNVMGHKHDGTVGESPYVFAPLLIERVLEGPLQPLRTYRYSDSYWDPTDYPDPFFKEGSLVYSTSSYSFITLFSKTFSNFLADANNHVYVDLGYSLYAYATAGAEVKWQYETNETWKDIGATSYQSGSGWNIAYFRTNGILLFDGKSPFRIRLIGRSGDSGWLASFGIAYLSQLILFK